MSPEAQRIAIAEACPALFRSDAPAPYLAMFQNEFWVFVNPLLDLNAMHEAEKVLRGDGSAPNDYRRIYADALRNLLGHDRGYADLRDCFGIATATAAQRAEAFLRTLGKWEDGK